MADPLGEFEFIDRLLKPLATHEASLGLTDDAAVLDVPSGMSMVLTKDMLVEDVHYLADDPPGDIAKKALRVNLSDLAAMGAYARTYLMGLSINRRRDRAWLERFAAGLAEDQASFGVSLIGGDVTSTPGPTTISITALGEVPQGYAVKRSGARAGDVILVSGTIGDAALGLAVRRGEIAGDEAGALLSRYRLPMPRLALAPLLTRFAHAAIDISDGLVSDLGHIARESALGAVIDAARVPLSVAGRDVLSGRPDLLETVLTGGDDYEIAFTAACEDLPEIIDKAADLHIPLTSLGHIEDGEGIVVRDSAGQAMALRQTGYTHFQDM